MPFSSHCLRVISSVVLILFIGVVTGMQAQELQPVHFHPTLFAIEAAHRDGAITREEAILQQIYAGFKPEALDASFRLEGAPPIRCMTPVIQEYYSERDRLSPSVVSEIDQLIANPCAPGSADNSYLSPSGDFIFYYITEGTHAVPAEDTNNSGVPDYVERAAFAADSSWQHQVQTLGFVDFLLSEPYEICFRNFGFYGTTTSAGNTTFITIHSTFDGFPPNHHPEGDRIGALYVTMAHEIKHAVQYVTNRWRGNAGSFNWIEMDATLMEEIVFDDVNDYYNYLFDSSMNHPDSRSIFGSPEDATPGAYWHMTWMLYFAEHLGMPFWVDVWEQFRDEPTLDFIDGMKNVLEPQGLEFKEQHLLNHMWHMASGEFGVPALGFSEREYYPTPNVRQSFTTIPDSTASRPTLEALAANYYTIEPATVADGQATITISGAIPDLGVGMVATFNDGSSQFQTFFAADADPERSEQFFSGWGWDDIERLTVAVVNGSREKSISYSLHVESTPFKLIAGLPHLHFELKQNVPNPLNSETTIEFELFEPAPVTLQIYDSAGRLVQTLIDEELGSAVHAVTFDGTGLSSGVYFYRLRTNRWAQTRKMVLVK